MLGKPDPLAAALDAVTKPRRGGMTLRVEALFANRPEVTDAIKRARRERGLSFRQIAELISTPDETITEGAVQLWLKRQGIT